MSKTDSSSSDILATSSATVFNSAFSQKHKDISDLLKAAPVPDTTGTCSVINESFPAILESILYLAQSELQAGNVVLHLLGDSFTVAKPQHFFLVSKVSDNLIALNLIIDRDKSDEMFVCNCIPPFGYAVLTHLGLSLLRPSSLAFSVIPGALHADCGVQSNFKRMKYEENYATHNSSDFKSKKQYNVVKPTRILFQHNQAIMDTLLPLNLISENSTIIQLNTQIPNEYKKLPAIRFGLEALLTFAFKPELTQVLPTTSSETKLRFLHIQHFILNKISTYEDLKLACVNLVHVTAAVF
jgi:hypothetical protein